MPSYVETAESIVEHAEAIAGLDAKRLDRAAFDAAVSERVHAIRLLAVGYVEPRADRAFFRALKAASVRAHGVFVHLPEGIVEFLVDTSHGQVRFELWNAAELHGGGRD